MTKFRPCIFKACGKVSHIGRARWDAKLGGWVVREMRPGHTAAPSLYGPSAVYSITWLTRKARDAEVEAAAKQAEQWEREAERAKIRGVIIGAIDKGHNTMRATIAKACAATGADKALVRDVFDEAIAGGSIYRVAGGKWAVNDDIPF